MTTSAGNIPQDQFEFGMKYGHSPLAHHRVAVDFDGTLVPWAPWGASVEPEDGAVEALREFKAAGWWIMILTSRVSREFAEFVVNSKQKFKVNRFLDTQVAYLTELLGAAGIPYDEITAEKKPAQFYIDDMALRYEHNWAEITRKVLDAG